MLNFATTISVSLALSLLSPPRHTEVEAQGMGTIPDSSANKFIFFWHFNLLNGFPKWKIIQYLLNVPLIWIATVVVRQILSKVVIKLDDSVYLDKVVEFLSAADAKFAMQTPCFWTPLRFWFYQTYISLRYCVPTFLEFNSLARSTANKSSVLFCGWSMYIYTYLRSHQRLAIQTDFLSWFCKVTKPKTGHVWLTSKFRTAWENVSQEHPGTRTCLLYDQIAPKLDCTKWRTLDEWSLCIKKIPWE